MSQPIPVLLKFTRFLSKNKSQTLSSICPSPCDDETKIENVFRLRGIRITKFAITKNDKPNRDRIKNHRRDFEKICIFAGYSDFLKKNLKFKGYVIKLTSEHCGHGGNGFGDCSGSGAAGSEDVLF